MTPREMADLAHEMWRIGLRLDQAASDAEDATIAGSLYTAADLTSAVTREIHAAARRLRALNAMQEDAA